MEYCAHCGDHLIQRGRTLVLCQCSASLEAEQEERARSSQWRRERAKAVESQKKLQRRNRIKKRLGLT